MSFRVAALILILGTVSSSAFCEDEITSILANHPDPARSQYYSEHRTEITKLLNTAQSAPSVQERLVAFEALSISFPDAASLEAARLVGDEVTAVAVMAAEVLASSIVMSDHSHGEARSPYHEFTLATHERARRALLAAIQDPRPEVRSTAASILASLSDADALQRIDAATAAGLYSQVEAVNYFGIAKPSVGVQYLERYLETGSTEARASAVQYLSANPRYQARIRDRILFNSHELVPVRTAAAKALGQHDKLFNTYAFSMALNPKIPPQVYLEIWRTYLSSEENLKSLDPQRQKALRQSLKSFSKSNPKIDVAVLLDQIQF